MNRLFRVVLVLGFLFALGAAKPAAASFCNEYECYWDDGGGAQCFGRGEKVNTPTGIQVMCVCDCCGECWWELP